MNDFRARHDLHKNHHEQLKQAKHDLKEKQEAWCSRSRSVSHARENGPHYEQNDKLYEDVTCDEELMSLPSQ